MNAISENKMKPLPRSKRANRKWYLVTNDLNMQYILAAGMVMGPTGFNGKHYQDPLDNYPGWIPFLTDNEAIASMAAYATSERKHLRPCIAEFNLEKNTFPIQVLSKNGQLRRVEKLTIRKRKDDVAILIPAPIPITLLSKIHFGSEQDLQSFEANAKRVSNVDITLCPMAVSQDLFSSNPNGTWPIPSLEGDLLDSKIPHRVDEMTLLTCPVKDTPPVQGHVLGGVLSMLYHLANRSDLGVATYLSAVNTCKFQDFDRIKEEPILNEFPNWLESGTISDQADIRAKLYWGVVQSIIDAKITNQDSPETDIAMAYLEDQLLNFDQNNKIKNQLEQLLSDMRNCFGLGTETISELLQKHKGPLSRPLLLFCLRKTGMELLEFHHSLLNDVEYILAGILFGVREGWLRLPKALRDPALTTYLIPRMANRQYALSGLEANFISHPAPIPLRKLFSLTNGTFDTKAQHKEAWALIKKQGWKDAIQTRITLSIDTLPAYIPPKGNELILPCEAKATTEINIEKFMEYLGAWPPVPEETQIVIRKKIKPIN